MSGSAPQLIRLSGGSGSQTVLEPSLAEPTSGGRWMVTMFDNDTNSMEEVVDVLIRATGCTIDEAEIEMLEAHTVGQAHVHFASEEECLRVASIISSIGVRTEVSPEWID